MKSFILTDKFIHQYEHKKAPFGFNGLGEFVYYRTYSRIKENGENEQWHETTRRVVEGTYSIQKDHVIKNGLHWDEEKSRLSAEEMFDRMFNMKFLPPGRGLWSMGSPITDRGDFEALQNCAFISTDNNKSDPSYPYCFLFENSMLGVGVAFDVSGAGQTTIQRPLTIASHYRGQKNEDVLYEIPDNREGWIESLKLLLNSYFIYNCIRPIFDYSLIRPAGSKIKTFGGISAGHEPLKQLHNFVRNKFDNREGELITVTDIMDIMNYIGKVVIAGNVRRTAELSLGSYLDEEYLDLKNYKKNGHRAEYGWTSNNSVSADIGMDYTSSVIRTRVNGEPGYFWLDNARRFGRFVDGENWVDSRAMGTNPCGEQTLESGEMCTLVEVFLNRAESKEDYLRTLKFAYLYAKTVTLAKTKFPKTNAIMLRNRRIGTSLTGIAQFLESHNIEDLRKWSHDGYAELKSWDNIYSEWFCVPESIKISTIKPSGTVSLLAGATSGVHYPESQYYIRRVRISSDSPLLEPLAKANYHIEPVITTYKLRDNEENRRKIEENDRIVRVVHGMFYDEHNQTVEIDIVTKEILNKEELIPYVRDLHITEHDPNTSVVSFPIFAGNIRTNREVSMWEKLELAAFMQYWWSDNAVSVTVTFNKDEAKDIKQALEFYQYRLKSVSFLPLLEQGAYDQMPYEKIDEVKYAKFTSELGELDLSKVKMEETDKKADMFCSTDYCEIKTEIAEIKNK